MKNLVVVSTMFACLLVAMYSWTRVFREIWTDGRTIPSTFNPDLRRWYGYSAGRWEGNTLVVESAGFDSRTWIDQFGYPMSEQMRLEVRSKTEVADAA